MAAVADLERFLERVFERTSARVFRARLQPVQVERRVERAMEAARNGRGTSTAVPSRYRVRLYPADLDDLAARSDGAAALAGRLADAALAFARRHGYHLATRPTVILVSDPAVERGRVEVDALPASSADGPASDPDGPGAAAEPVIVAPQPLASTPDPVPAPSTDRPRPAPVAAPTFAPPYATVMPPSSQAAASEQTGAVPVVPVVPVAARGAPPAGQLPASPPPPPPAVATPGIRGIRADPGETAVFRRPAPPPARAVLRQTSGGPERTIEVAATPMTVGRAPDNAVVLADARISRHHGRLQARRGTLVFTDLGSTNGSRVNGIRVDEIVLGLGDRLQLGDVVLVVESLPG